MKRITERLDGLGVISFTNPRDIGSIYTITDLDNGKDKTLLLNIAERLAEYEDLESRLQGEYNSDEINLNLLVEYFIKAIEEHDGEPFKGYRILTNKDALLYDKWKESL